jgi:5,10-methylenetetrahydromethanopterin reductase
MLLPRDLEQTRQASRLGEELGFSWLGVADSPTVYEDCYLHLLEAARATSSIAVGPVVSHVVARHPVIVANALATLNEFTDGRVLAVLGTGNSAARGLKLKPASVDLLRQGVEAIRSYWRGEGGRFGESEIPATGIEREGCPLLLSADGPNVAALAGEVGDGLLYGGSLEAEVVARRVAAARAVDEAREVWAAPAVSLWDDRETVKSEVGAFVVAMANRAIRGDLGERGVPPELHDDVREMWSRYDYAFHADASRPRNLDFVSPRLADYLTDTTCVWGDSARWEEQLDALEDAGCDGVHFLIGQREPLDTVRAMGFRLRELGRL